MKLVVILLMMLALDETVDQVAASGQVVGITATPEERLGPPALIAPGVPPALGFRMIEGKLRHRFGDLDLVLDDAGH
ncbi:MAG TPA: hypothetical protein VKU19_21355 [Bryobacteraceae bacterium]|nr:hypothetical protein [Bryobacteraceae bacterium]